MNRTIRIIAVTFISICIIIVATERFIKQHSNRDTQISAPQNENELQLNNHLLERMNHKIVDASIPKSSISFEQCIFDFGTIKNGDEVIHRFKFRNAGNNPLIIFNVKSTCGCTVPAWSNDLVNPGDTSSIVIKFNSSNENGLQNKKVRVFANSNPVETDIFFKVDVIN